jgi:hypothetical protein
MTTGVTGITVCRRAGVGVLVGVGVSEGFVGAAVSLGVGEASGRALRSQIRVVPS